APNRPTTLRSEKLACIAAAALTRPVEKRISQVELSRRDIGFEEPKWRKRVGERRALVPIAPSSDGHQVSGLGASDGRKHDRLRSETALQPMGGLLLSYQRR